MKFAANLSMMFTEHGFEQRFAAAANAGFQAIEFLFPYQWPAAQLRQALERTSMRQVLFNLPPGDWDAGDRGLASLPDRQVQFLEGLTTALPYIRELAVPRVHCMAGVRNDSISHDTQRETFVGNLMAASEQLADTGVQVLIEPINSQDMPGYFLNDFGLALEIIEEVNVARPGAVRLQFDIYHCQMIHGDVTGWLQKCQHQTQHLQIAGVPGRNEPGTGTLPLAAIMETCEQLHPDLWIGCEYRPKGNTQDGLGWLKPYRTPE